MNPIKFCSILSVMLGATSFLVVVEASEASQETPSPKSTSALPSPFTSLSPSTSAQSTLALSSPSTSPSLSTPPPQAPSALPSPSLPPSPQTPPSPPSASSTSTPSSFSSSSLSASLSLYSSTTTPVPSKTRQSTTPSTGPPTTKTFEARMTVNETYEPGYSNSSSAEFKTFATNFSKTVGEFLSKKLFGFERVEVKNLASGSVVVDFDIVVLKSSNATVDVIVLALEAGNPSELGYTILGNVNVNATDQQSTSSIPSPTATVAETPSPKSTSALPSAFTSPSPSTSAQSTLALPSPSTSPSLSTPPPQVPSALPSPSLPPSPQKPPSPPSASSTSTPSSSSSSSLSASLSLYSSTTTPVPSSKTRQSTTPSTDVPTEGSKEFKGSGSIDNEWEGDYANSSTPAYKRLYRDMKDHLTAVLKKSYEDNFIGVEVSNFREGSIKFDFTVYLKATTIVNEETLKDVIQKGEGGSNFTITGVSVKQIAGPKPTTSTTEKPETESGLEKWKIVLIATVPVIFILLIALLVVVHQNRRLSSTHKRNFAVSDHSRSVPARMYSASANTKEMYQLTGHGTENAGSRISREFTTFSPDNEDLNGTSNRAFIKMEGDKSERDNQSLDGSKSDASDKDSVRYSSGVGFI